MDSLSTQMVLIDAAVHAIEFALNWLLQSSLLISVGLIVGRLLRSRGSAVQSGVYRTTLVAVLVCPLAAWGISQVGVSGWSLELPSEWGQQETKYEVAKVFQEHSVPETEMTTPGLAPTNPEIELAPKYELNVGKEGPSDDPTIARLNIKQEVETSQVVTGSSADIAELGSAKLSPSLLGYLAAVLVSGWVMISLVLAARLAIAYRRLTKLRTCAVQADEHAIQTCQALSSTLGVTAPDVLRSPYFPSPCLVGFRNPTVILPEFDHGLSLREVLIHELAHLHRHDCHWNLLRRIATTLFFFQPLLWKLSRWIETTAEEVCDDYVVQLGGDRHDYAHRLVNIAELSSVPIAAAGVGIVSLRSMVAKRVSRILDTSRTPSTRVGNSSLACLLISGLLATAAAALVGVSPTSSQAEAKDVAELGGSSTQADGQSEAEHKGNRSADNTVRKKIEPVTLEFDAPKLIAVWPANGAENVELHSEVHLRFDRPIDPLSFDLKWIKGGYLKCGKIEYLKDKNELVIPIQLLENRQHEIVINSNNRGMRLTGFMSTDGTSVKSTAWKFRTKAHTNPKDGQEPRIVSVHPPLETEVSRVTFVRLKFDQPMDPVHFDLPRTRFGKGESTEFNAGVSYKRSSNEFVLPIVLPANWSGEVIIDGFKSQNGVDAEPVKLSYSTTNEVLSEQDLNRLTSRDSISVLRDLVLKVQQARRRLRSVSETIHSVTYGGRDGLGFSQLSGNWSRFKMQGKRQFYGDVSQIMGIPFRMGSDGENCWFFSQRPNKDRERVPTLISCKFDEIQNKSLAFANPFEFDTANLEKVVKQRRLEHMGRERVNDVDCHVVRSLKVHELGRDNRILLIVNTWWIDADTLRPIQVVTDSSHSRTVNRYVYDSVNQQLALSEFQPTVPDQTSKKGLEPLGDGYDERYLKLSDGTNGRMSSRWGKTGSSGTSSSGLN